MSLINISDLTNPWSMLQAIKFIREIQKVAWASNIHLALAGSVLNRGESNNDLDIIVMDQNNDKPSNWQNFRRVLEYKYGSIELKTGAEYHNENRNIYSLILRDTNQAIDLFVYDKIDTKQELFD